MTTTWSALGSRAPRSLAAARVEAHWAVQLVGAAANALLAHRADDSQSTMSVHGTMGALVGEPLPQGRRVGVRLAPLELIVSDANDHVTDSLGLTERTLDDARRWLEQVLDAGALSLRDYEMPDAPVGHGAAFGRAAIEDLAELQRWYENGVTPLEDLAARDARATSVRIWPHHFDAGGIVFLEHDTPAEGAAQIGFGLSPGDSNFDQPYFYVTPWPLPANPELPALPAGGIWTFGALSGAVLTGEAVVGDTNAQNQQENVRTFFEASLAAGERVVLRSREETTR